MLLAICRSANCRCFVFALYEDDSDYLGDVSFVGFE